MCAVQDRRVQAYSKGRVRYSLSPQLLAEIAEAEVRGQRMRVDTRALRAEVEVELYQTLLTEIEKS